MASGSYAHRAYQRGAPIAVTQPSRGLAIVYPSMLWILYPIGAVCVLMGIISTGLLNPRPITSSYVTTTGGQSYSIQVGGDQAGSWQKDQAATIPTPIPQPQATPTPQPSGRLYSVEASPSVSVDFINQVLSTYKSPTAGKGQILYDLGVQYGIDPAYALAFFMHESSFGTKGVATKSLSLGNLRCIPNFRCEENFAHFDSWEDGCKAWYQLIRNLYIAEWGLTTVDQIIPRYAPAADNNNEAAYIAALKHAIDTWHSGAVVVR